MGAGVKCSLRPGIEFIVPNPPAPDGPTLVRVRTLLVALAVSGAACVVVAAGEAAPLPAGFERTATGPNGGALYRGTFPSATAPGPLRPGYVYLPPGFSTSSRYPVVYLLHGMPGDPSEYVSALQIAILADRLISTARIRPFIAVIPAAGTDGRYNGEWAGPWDRYLVHDVVPWVDANLPTIADRSGRTLAGLSAGGFGAMDIGLRSPLVFGAMESWSGYFQPLRDGPFKHADPRVLAANDPTLLVAEKTLLLHRLGTRFFVGSGPSHSHWFKEQGTIDFAHELRRLGLPHTLLLDPLSKGQYGVQLADGLAWALPA